MRRLGIISRLFKNELTTNNLLPFTRSKLVCFGAFVTLHTANEEMS